MATMALPMANASTVRFDDVEVTVDVVKAGVRFTNRAGFLLRTIAKVTFLSYAFSKAVDQQGELIDELNGSVVQGYDADRMLALAGQIEHLVLLNDELLRVAYPGKFEPWNRLLVKIADQRDTLESIAQSFRGACDPEHQSLLIAALETVYA